ncbi:exodeoxyribonuclease III [Candidatus Marinarcus aquaticus]|uniref:Exodeoxyribonuclease III n=1 Tax=Candidatus Marinarcus aquaticus TaxID=2044504 RepID=A0A4Q0XTB7_9BACT|nr:exodeoxyribonuclease III [Candidatus Marinarcus aquaticus]RXJ60592.1 exodeoxyribonuclease III [Candidatus Marinarcus aquaticus]
MDLKLVSWNVNGIRAVDKKEALKWIDEHQIDILALQEIKAEKEQIPKTIFNKEYAHIQVNSSSRKGQSGTALFTDITPTFISETPHVDILNEGRINEFHFENIAFFNVYFPNGQSKEERLVYKLEFYERFLEYINTLRKEGKSIIVCGDVNTAHTEIDLARPKANEETSGFLPIERAWIDKLLEHGYVDTFRHINGNEPNHYSWWSYRANARANNVGWRIDYFFVSDDLKDRIKNAYIMPDIFGSDHCPVALEIAL